MKNFDYLKNYANLADLYAYCHTAELKQVSDPEKSALKRYFAITATDRYGNENAPLALNAPSEMDIPILNKGN